MYVLLWSDISLALDENKSVNVEKRLSFNINTEEKLIYLITLQSCNLHSYNNFFN